tara:strand:+ start:196 stop:663 length:468 start_codon:yes stop_codon:yes gene_type:complete
MNNTISSYEEVVGYFQEACEKHVAIETFAEGAIDYLDANSQNIKYPFVFLRPLASPGITVNTRTLTFELYSLDVPKLSNQSPLQVKSNTEQYIYDVMSYINYGPVPPTDQNGFDVEMSNMTPVNEAFNDRVYGWVAQVTVAQAGIFNFCLYPQLP